jgi:DNA-binding beta-propeller fold protein YncE
MTLITKFQLAFACALLLFANNMVAQTSGYQLIKKTVIGGEGGWDYLSVDAENRRLYVSHSTKVEVLNADTHEKIGEIPNLQGVHGVIAVPKAGRGITTNGRGNTATIFDLKTLKTIVELPTGKNPDALLYDEFSKRVFIFNHSDVTTTAIDIEAGKVVGTLDLGGTALEAGATDENGSIFVNLEEAHEIVSFDAKTLVVKNRWKIAPCEEPTGLAIDTKTKRLFSVCHNGWMMVIDSEKGNVVTQVPIGKRVDGVVFDPKSKLAFSSNGEGTITVVQELSANEFKVVETIKTEVGARTIALDSKTHHVFVSTAQYGETPAATAEVPNPRPKVMLGTFMILEYGKK